MISAEYAQLLARYKRWMNDKVYAASEQLTDAERKADSGAFFKLIHSTLNHQTHHRGQVTTLLSQQKIDLGATDLMMMPNQNL